MNRASTFFFFGDILIGLVLDNKGKRIIGRFNAVSWGKKFNFSWHYGIINDIEQPCMK